MLNPVRPNDADQLLENLHPWARRLIWLAISLGYEIGLAAAELPPPTREAIKASLERAHTTGSAPWIPAAAAPAVELGRVLNQIAAEQPEDALIPDDHEEDDFAI